MAYTQTVNTEFSIKIESNFGYVGKSSMFSLSILNTLTLVETVYPTKVSEPLPGFYVMPVIINAIGDYVLIVKNSELWSSGKKISINIVEKSTATVVDTGIGGPVVMNYVSAVTS
jgi:hypothetical protein